VKQRKQLLEKIEKALLQRQDEIIAQLSSTSNGKKAFEGQVKDSGDEVLSLSLEKLQSSLQQTEIDELHLIKRALERLKKNEYGICIDCGEPISAPRLDNYPYAARCIVCQELVEEGTSGQ